MLTGVLTAGGAAIVTVAPSAPRAEAVPATQERVFYQRSSSSPWNPDDCPGDARYHTNYGCVTNGSVSAYSTLHSANPDGSDEQEVDIDCAGTDPHWKAPWEWGGVRKIAVDAANGKLYWESSFEPGIARANLDGSGCELVANGGYYGKVSIAIDDAGAYLYSVQNSTLRRVNTATGVVENLSFSGLGSFVPSSYSDLTVSGTTLYATLGNVASAGHILAVTLDTSTTTQAAQLLVTGEPAGMAGVSVDADNGFIYWATGSAVKRAHLSDGSDVETIATGSYNYVTAVPAENTLLMGQTGGSIGIATELDGTFVGTTGIQTATYPTAGSVPDTRLAQTVTWSPTTALSTADSPVSPAAATTDGDGTISYGVISAGTTGCTVHASTGELTFTGVGDCVVRATAASTATSRVGFAEATFHITAPATTTTTSPTTTTVAGDAPDLSLQLGIASGEVVGGGTVEVVGTGLEPHSQVTVELHSTPIEIGSGFADADGEFSLLVTLPAEIPPGEHTIVAVGTKVGGGAIAAEHVVFVDWDGAFVDTDGGLGHVAIEPHRLLDTRQAASKVAAGVVTHVPVATSVVPADAAAVVATWTVTQPGAAGYLTVFPCAGGQPATSTLNFGGGTTVANMAITSIGAARDVCAVSSVDTHLVVDVSGYMADGGDLLTVVGPTRRADTRGTQRVQAGDTLTVPLDAPAGSTAAVLNVAAVDPAGDGYLTVFACDSTPPATSNANFAAGQNVAAHVIARIGGGAVCVRPSVTTDILVDIAGVMRPSSGSSFAASNPGRLLDTRGGAPVTAGSPVVLDLAVLPASATAAALNVTAAGSAGAGYVTVYPCGQDVPATSSLNVSAASDVANHVTAAIGASRTVCLVSSISTHLVVDVMGMYVSVVS